MAHEQLIYLFQMVIFHSYVSLPAGKYDKYDSNMEVSKKMGVPPKSSELGAHLNLVLPSLNGDLF
jgi:hypothetical protein